MGPFPTFLQVSSVSIPLVSFKGSLHYDAANRIKTTSVGGSEYDGDGRRVKQAASGYSTYYLWSSLLGEVAVEINSDGTIYRAYVYGLGGGQALAEQSYDGKFYWIHTDHLGSGKKLTDSSGAVVYRGEFDPHGQAVLESATGGATYLNSHKFTGYEREWATNLDYAKARTYSHNRARFLQPDPLGLAADLTSPQSLNRYSYVGNDPVNHIDPSGLRWIAKYEETCVGLVGEGKSCESRLVDVDWVDDDWGNPKGSGGASGGTPWEWSIPPNPAPNKEAKLPSTQNIAAPINQGLNLSPLGRKPYAGVGGKFPRGAPSSCSLS